MLSLLSTLDRLSIPYVSWKNNHELAAALEGGTDLDIFVPPWHAAAFRRAAQADCWVELVNRLARYPHVHHYYKISGTCVIFHLHVYFRVVTGDSWLKEYLLPLETWFIQNRERSPEWGVWVLKREAQAYIFVLRYLLKNGSVIGRLLFRNELAGYQEEWAKAAVPSLETAPVGLPTLEAYVSGLSLDPKSLYRPPLFSSLRVRYLLSSYLRVPPWSLPLRRLMQLFRRARNRLWAREKKAFIGRGLVIAISGPDGSGKTTLKQEAVDCLACFMTVRAASLGRPQPEWLNRIMASPLFVGRWKRASVREVRALKECRGPGDAVKGLLLAFLRRAAARAAVKEASRGHLVLSDRWPTVQLGYMDGPRLCRPEAGRFALLCSSLERWIYGSMPRADLCIYIRVSECEAVARNDARSKRDKESDDEIRSRHRGNIQHRALALEAKDFDNGGPLSVKGPEFIQTIWNAIADRYG